MYKYYLPIKRMKKETCKKCKGKGRAFYNVSHNEKRLFVCPVCKGEGTFYEEDTIDIRLPNIIFKRKK